MRNKNKVIVSAISAVLAMCSGSAAFAADKATPAAEQTEKCFGISKAGVNDCATGANSCAGSAVKDGQKDAFLLLPTGLCSKIVGGSLTSNK